MAKDRSPGQDSPHTSGTDHSPGPDTGLPDGRELALPWHLRLPDELERQFSRYFTDTSRKLIITSFFPALLLFAGGSALESIVLNDVLQKTWRPRLLVLFGLIAVYWCARTPGLERFMQPVTSLCVLTLALTHNYMGQLIESDFQFFYFLINAVAILLLGTLFRVTLHWAIPTVLVILFSLGVTLTRFTDHGNSEISALLFYTTVVAIMSLFGQYFFERLERQHFLAERVLSMHRNELHTANQMLENQVTEDGLTGTVNRRGLEARLESLFHACAQGTPGAPGRISLLLFDIDFFKQYNDTYGHQAGDECLRQVANIPRALVQRDRDFVARYGGEEFLVALVDSSARDAMVVAERMRARIEQLGLEHRGSRVSDVVTISVGVASARPATLTPAGLISEADDALYEAKEAGRNRVVFRDVDTGTTQRL